MRSDTENYKYFSIILSIQTIMEILLLIIFFFTHYPLLFLGGLLLLLPFMILWVFIIGIFIRCIRMREKWQRKIITWIVVLILLMPASFYVSKWIDDAFYSYAKIDLPDGNTMTVTYDKVIFDESEDTHNPQKDYIELFDGCEDYSLTLSQNDTLYIWTSSDSFPAKVHQLRYPVVIIYSNSNHKQDDYRVIINKIKWKFEYRYDNDGIHSGGTQSLTISVGDSLHVESWSILRARSVGRRDDHRESMTTYKDNLGFQDIIHEQ